MANRFRVFLSPIQLSTDNTEKVTLASCVLHNFLCERAPTKYTPTTSFDKEELDCGEIELGDWRGNPELEGIVVSGRNAYTKTAKDFREAFTKYFNSVEGSVPWQEKFI